MTQPDEDLPMGSVPDLALVTGGARRLGRAIAIELARQGFAIGLHYFQSQDAAEQVAAEIQALGVPVALLPADLRDPEQVDDLFRRVTALPNYLRVLVNSAGVMARANVMQLTTQAWDETMALNLRAPLLTAQLAAPLMRNGGLIVNITDVGARRAWTGFPAYAVSKAGLEALTNLLARALAPKIRVNAVAPGLILPSETVTAPEWERLIQRVPLQRAGTPEEVARIVAFFLHNEYITGQTIAIDGGYQMV